MVIICCAHDYHCFNIKISFKILFPGSRPTCNSISSVTKNTKHKMDCNHRLSSPSCALKKCNLVSKEAKYFISSQCVQQQQSVAGSMSNAAKLCWRIFYWHFYAQRHAGRPLLGTVGRYKNLGGWTFWIRRFFFYSFQNLRGQLHPPPCTNGSYGPVFVLFYRAKKNAATTRGLLALMMAQASLGCLLWAHFAIWREISHNF